jgi:hypothetical protein
MRYKGLIHLLKETVLWILLDKKEFFLLKITFKYRSVKCNINMIKKN